jgi:heme A synthase
MVRYAAATALATFLLLLAGNLVSTTESGLACPDWPLCEGQWIPPMVDGKEFEHTHRLIASFVGTMTVGLFALLFKHRRADRRLLALGAAAAALVIVQALLGALTVILKLPAWVSATHLGTAMAFFALIVSMPFLIHQRGLTTPAPPPTPGSRAARAWTLAAAIACYLQIVGGGIMRHTRSGLVCGFEYPLCLGQLWPLEGHLGVQIHMVHRMLALLVGALVWVAAAKVARASELPARRAWAWGLSVSVGAQVALGIATVVLSRDMAVMTLHSGLGAGLLALLVALYWTLSPAGLAAPRRALLTSPRLELA